MRIAGLQKSFDALGLGSARAVASQDDIQLIVSLPDQDACQAAQDRLKDQLELSPERQLPMVHGFTTRVDAQDLKQLPKLLPKGARVSLDAPIHFGVSHLVPNQPPKPTEVFSPRLPGVEKVWEEGFTGRGVTVAVVDSGIYPHPDLKDHVVAWHDFSKRPHNEMWDPIGHGTNVAGIVAGNGARSKGAIKGVAPEASLVGLRATSPSEAIQAVQWAIDNREGLGIKVLNMSMGVTTHTSASQDLWAQVTEKAVQAGITVVVSAGNDGPAAGTITSPANAPHAITVGAYDNHQTPDPSDDTLFSMSSRGPTAVDGLPKPDLVAPGVWIFGPLSPGSDKDHPDKPHLGKDYMAMFGTSQAAPMVAGLAALMLQANPRLTPDQLKSIMMASSTRTELPDGPLAQGAGLVHADTAVHGAQAA